MDTNMQTMTPNEVRQMLDLLRKGKAAHDRKAAEARVMSKSPLAALLAGEAKVVGIDRVTGAALVQPIPVASVTEIAAKRAEKWEQTLKEIAKADAKDRRVAEALERGVWTPDLDDYHVVKSVECVKSARGNTVKAIISSSHPDRLGDIVEASGWQLDNFKRNPVVLINHNYDALPVGKCVDIRVVGDELHATTQFADTERGRELAGMYAAGNMNAFSVGFRPLEWKPRKGSSGVHYTRQELLEYSCVSVPALPVALAVQP